MVTNFVITCFLFPEINLLRVNIAVTDNMTEQMSIVSKHMSSTDI